MNHSSLQSSQSKVLTGEDLCVPRNDPLISPLSENLQTNTIWTAKTSQNAHQRDASILLTGMAGAGKTTLAMIAAFALRRRYVSFSAYFEKQFGKSPTTHAQEAGLELYRKSELEVTKRLLQDCSSDCVIEGFSEFGGNAHRALLKNYAATNPVIYIRREKQELKKFISLENGRFDQLYKYCDAFYSSCSSYEFYNLSITASDQTATDGPASTLKLKATEIDFVRFLHRILGKPSRLLYSAEPFSSTHTNALQVSLSWLATSDNNEELESGCDAINFIVDVPEDEVDLQDRVAGHFAYIRRHSRLPIIFESRASSQKGQIDPSLLSLALKCLPDMIVIDLKTDLSQIADILYTKANIQKIGAYHFEDPWPGSLDDPLWSHLHLKAKSISCTAIRIYRAATNESDNLACTTFASMLAMKYGMPIIAYNTGKLGRTSVCLNPILSPIFPLSLASDGISLQQANAALYSCFIATKKRFAIFGKDVTYSLSPAMHNAAYQAIGMPHTYDFIRSDNFSDIHQLLEDEEYAGVAVTLPFKTDAWLMLNQRVSDEAREIGAVNTITIHRAETTYGGDSSVVLKGHNTDHIGLRECIYRNLSPANLVRANTSALILGAGGMARAALYACETLGVRHFCIHNRTLGNAQALAHSWLSNHPDTRIHMLESFTSVWPLVMSHPTIIISTIPAQKSERGQPHDPIIPPSWLQSRTGGVFIEVRTITYRKPPVPSLFPQYRD